MNKLIFSVFILATILSFQLRAQDIDEANGATGVAAPYGELQPLRAGIGTSRILWDTSHGVLNENDPGGKFSLLSALLAAKNQIVESSDVGILNLDLRSYDTLVICVLSSWDSAYSEEEVNRIHEYVVKGGTILILSDNYLVRLQQIDPVAAAFGITLSRSPLNSSSIITDIRPLPMMSGIETFEIFNGGQVVLTPPLEVAAAASLGETVLGVGQFGAGRVVCVGDTSMFNDFHIGEADNQLLVENMFDYLTAPTVPLLSSKSQLVFIILLLLTGTVMMRKSRIR